MTKFISILILLFSVVGIAQVQHIEPPFWWSNMNASKLQLLFHGDQLSEYDITFSDGIPIINVIKTENPNYQFITIDTKDISPKTSTISFSKNGKVMFTKPYEFKPRRKDSRYRKGFDSSDAIYLVMPDRFANGNPNNDSTDTTIEKADRTNPNGRHGGDIKGIIAHLDYIKDLGMTALWSTPLLEDNEPKYSYHTYAQSDLYHIDPRYGTNEDYKRLAKEMHQRDMKLIMDYVTNHWGSTHWMIKDLPSKDFIHFWEGDPKGFQRSSYRMSTQFDPNVAKKDAKACMNGWFDTSMPDMNQSNPLVLQYMIQNAIWWIEYADLDGLRVDTYSYNDKAGIANWTKAIMEEYPNFNIVGEVWLHNQAQIAYWQKDSKIGAIQNFNSHLPSVMDFTLHDAILEMFNETKKDAWNAGMIKAYENLTNDFLYTNIHNLLVFAGNHDTNRINEIYGDNLDQYKLIMTLIATVRGIPQFYYGDEIGMMGNRDKKGDANIRQDFPGGWKTDSQNAFTSLGRNKKQNAYFNFTKKIFNWRKGAAAIHKGRTMQFVPEHNVYVYFRYTDSDKIMVIINNNLEAQQLDMNRFSEMLTHISSGFDILSEKKIPLNNLLQVNGKTSMILQL